MWLLKAGGCLIQFKYISLRILGQLSSGCLIQVGCLTEVTTNTGLTVPVLLIHLSITLVARFIFKPVQGVKTKQSHVVLNTAIIMMTPV